MNMFSENLLIDKLFACSVDDKGAFVDVGGKAPAWIPINEVSNFKLVSVSS